MSFFKTQSTATAAAVAFLILAIPQNANGVIVGRVTDRSGNSLPGVTVTLSTATLAPLMSAVTDITGMYRFAGLPPGTYTIEFRLVGFDTGSHPDIPVEPGARIDVDAVLEPAALETVGRVANLPKRAPAHVRAGEVVVEVATSLGKIEIAADAAAAPITAANFLRYVDGGFYTNGRFHRATRSDNYTVALPNRPLLECIQGGIDPVRRADSFRPIPLERTNVTGLKHLVGTVSMARSGPDTATSDFFILLNDQPSLDFGGKRFEDGQGAAAFGRVVAGLDVVRRIQQQPTAGQSLAPPVRIVEMRRAGK